MLALGGCRAPTACRRGPQPAQASASAGFSSPVGRAKLARRAALVLGTAAAATSLHPANLLKTLSMGGAGGGAGVPGGSGGGGGGGGGGQWHGALPAFAEEESDYFEEKEEGRGPQPAGGDKEDDEEKFLCEGITTTNLPSGPGIPSKVQPRDLCCPLRTRWSLCRLGAERWQGGGRSP